MLLSVAGVAGQLPDGAGEDFASDFDDAEGAGVAPPDEPDEDEPDSEPLAAPARESVR